MKSAITPVIDASGSVRLNCEGDFPVGVSAGFIGRGILDSPLTLEQARDTIKAGFPDYAIILPEQTHGDAIVIPREGHEEEVCSGDAISIDLPIQRRILACIRTADCVPLILIAASRVALVHAGWRGLANGIIKKTFQTFHPDEQIEVFIGPSACGNCYQVGREVIDAIGQSSVVVERQGSFWLDTAGTAAALVSSCAPRATVTLSGICTIENRSFHSFRRDGDQSGRNISFIAIS